METGSRSRYAVATCLCAFALAGCDTITAGAILRTKSETELAVAAVKDEWLIDCDGVANEMPPNSAGDLLQDYVDVAKALAECRARQKSFVSYMRPIVKKERAAKPATP